MDAHCTPNMNLVAYGNDFLDSSRVMEVVRLAGMSAASERLMFRRP